MRFHVDSIVLSLITACAQIDDDLCSVERVAEIPVAAATIVNPLTPTVVIWVQL